MNDSLELQYSLLGNYLSNPDLFLGLEHLLRDQLFTSRLTKESYRIIKTYHNAGRGIDKNLLDIELKSLKFAATERAEASGFNDYPLSDKQVEEYVKSLFSDYTRFYLQTEFKLALDKLSKGEDPISVMTITKDAVTNVELVVNNVSKDKSIYAHFDDAMSRITDLKSGEIERSGFSFGLPALDDKTGGLPEGITVIAGGKGAGKTTLVVNIIRANTIDDAVPVLLFSMEMKARDILINLMANYKEINSRSLRTGNVDEEQIESLRDLKSKLKESFVIDETGGITHQYFETKVRAFRKTHKIPIRNPILVMLDYLQLMKNVRDEMRMNKEERVEHICTELMRICKNENVSLVLLSQFSRDVDKRGDGDKYNKLTDEEKMRAYRPKMSDLKGSSAIEANAVLILLLYRPDYIGIEKGKGGMDLRGLCEINIAKGRFVNPEPVYARFLGKYSKFADYVDDGIKGLEEAF